MIIQWNHDNLGIESHCLDDLDVIVLARIPMEYEPMCLMLFWSFVALFPMDFYYEDLYVKLGVKLLLLPNVCLDCYFAAFGFVICQNVWWITHFQMQFSSSLTGG